MRGSALREGVNISVRVTPRGGRDAIDGWVKDSAGKEQLKVRLRVPAEGGKANEALVDLLAKALKVPRGAVTILSGTKARLKIVRIDGDQNALAEQLNELGVKN